MNHEQLDTKCIPAQMFPSYPAWIEISRLDVISRIVERSSCTRLAFSLRSRISRSGSLTMRALVFSCFSMARLTSYGFLPGKCKIRLKKTLLYYLPSMTEVFSRFSLSTSLIILSWVSLFALRPRDRSLILLRRTSHSGSSPTSELYVLK